MQLDHVAHQGQSNSKSVNGAARRRLHLEKQVEDSWQHGRFDSDARIAHAQYGSVPDRLQSEFDVAPILRILGAVVQQV